MFSSTAKLACSCKLDLVLFTVDTQSCHFRFVVFDFSTEQMDLVVDTAASNRTPIEFTENDEREVLSTEAERNKKNLLRCVTASVIIRICRRPCFYYRNIYTPTFSIAFFYVFSRLSYR
ncbi:neuronal acetylcholine receptor subunit alpha-10 [Plakobranchus ocellatus]|uniref:Neuronal acetylcholine receptor subunit alpha-10 n=1 Tax=Plakobranchus ocellatus TaxID=259542 RepID=A0AAV4DNG3_9GAST|nr:neuronal acetylcholine receptor subunit alpha-10 [Plakobranchus ocellatus]